MKYFIIRLKNNPISEKYAAECVNQAKQFNIDIEYFDAVNGLDYQKHLDRLEIKPKYKFKKNRPGVFGCFLSHYYLWKQCSTVNIPYVILEHDGYIIKPFPADVLNHFKDVLKLDELDPYSKSYEKFLKTETDSEILYKKYYNPTAKFLEKTQTGNYMRGAYGYIIKPHAARHIVNWISTNGFVPADQQIGDALVDIQVVTPSLVRLHPDYFRQLNALSLTGNTELL